MVGARAAMQHRQRRLLPHDGTLGDELRALEVEEEQPYRVHDHMRGAASLAVDPFGQAACFFGADTKPYRVKPAPDSEPQSQFRRTPSLMSSRFRCHADLVVRAECRPDFI